MIQLTTLTALAASTALWNGAANAAAVFNFPPPGSTMFISTYSTSSAGPQVCPTVQCNLASSLGNSVVLPSATFLNSSGVLFNSSSGSIGATVMHGFVSGNIGTELDLALHDTYTVWGTAVGLFPVTFTFSASGIASAVQTQLIAAGITLTIGDFDIVKDGDGDIPAVHEFDASTRAVGTAPDIFSGGGSRPISATLIYTRMVSVGDVFDLGFEMTLGAVKGTVDLSNTATISFTTPNGVFLTSALAAVPEPPSSALWAVGALALWRLSRRRLSVG